MPTLDENDLGSGLRALSEGAPPAPDERVRRSVTRARRIRARRVAGTVAAVAALVVGVPVLVPRGAPKPVPADMASAVRQWPAHRERKYRAYEDAALDQAWLPVRPGVDGWTLHRLYTGDVPFDPPFGHDRPVVVAFAVCRDGCHLALMIAAPADGGGPARSGWVRVTGWVAPGAPTRPLAWLLDGDVVMKHGVTTLLLVLPPPGATRLTWRAPTLAGSQGSTARPRDGLFAVDAGFVTADPEYTLTDARGGVLYTGPARVPGARQVPVGRSELTPPIELPAGLKGVTGSGEQLDNGDSDTFDMDIPRGTRFWFFFRCLGPVPVTVTGPGVRETVRCDGEQRTLLADRPAPASGTYRVTYASSSPYVSYQAEFASPARPGQ
jgi:hypothetical protein